MSEETARRAGAWGSPAIAEKHRELADELERLFKVTGDSRFRDAAVALSEARPVDLPKPGRPKEYPKWFPFLIWAHVESRRRRGPNLRPYSAKKASELLSKDGGVSWTRNGKTWKIDDKKTILYHHSRSNSAIKRAPDSEIANAAKGWLDSIAAGDHLLWPEIPEGFQ